MGILLRSPQAGGVLELSDLRNPSLVSDLRTLAEYQSPSCHLCYVPKFLNKTSEKVFRFHLESHTPATGPTWWGGDLCSLHRALLGASTWERGAKKGRSISDAGVGATGGGRSPAAAGTSPGFAHRASPLPSPAVCKFPTL